MKLHRTNKADPPPLPQDEGGWRVAPAPDGRGMHEQHKPQAPHRLRGFWIVVIALLALNSALLGLTRRGGHG
jgi:hypothetical protein